MYLTNFTTSFSRYLMQHALRLRNKSDSGPRVENGRSFKKYSVLRLGLKALWKIIWGYLKRESRLMSESKCSQWRIGK